jgi:hypothetical protein
LSGSDSHAKTFVVAFQIALDRPLQIPCDTRCVDTAMSTAGTASNDSGPGHWSG